jgi:hypothetical protein
MLCLMSDTILRAHKLTGRSRRPKTVDGVRVCAHEECTTVLSRYNRKGTCNLHAPIKFPRVRGHEVPAIEL